MRLGIEWTGEQPLTILTKDNMGFTCDGVSVPLRRYTPLETTVNTSIPRTLAWIDHASAAA